MTARRESVTEDATVFTPNLLFDICLTYISRNISLVESLNGFPEIIGERLFNSCVKYGNLLGNDPNTQYCIRLFVDSYGKDFMESFRCDNALLMHEYSECLMIMCAAVTHLDLRGCHLGNNNDFLREIVKMKDLQVLNLSKNEISDDGFRLLLARHRMYKEGFQKLLSFDVSENVLSLKNLKTLLKMPKLRYLCVSLASSLKFKEPKFVQGWVENIRACKFSILPVNQRIPLPAVTTKGMGAEIITAWEGKTNELEAVRLSKIEQRKKRFFTSHVNMSEHQVFKPNIASEKFDTYSYMREKLPSNTVPNFNEPVIAGMTREEKTAKRKSCFVFQEGQAELAKRPKKSKEQDMDMELLKMYIP